MVFTQLFSELLNENGNYKKLVKVLKCAEVGKDTTTWIDIRSCYDDGKDCKSTKGGVCITPEELETLLPKMMEGKQYELESEKRLLQFKPSAIHRYIYDLSLRKFDGKESALTLTMTEIRKMNFIREKIFEKCMFESKN